MDEERQVDDKAARDSQNHERARALGFRERVKLPQGDGGHEGDKAKKIQPARHAQEINDRDGDDANGDALREIAHRALISSAAARDATVSRSPPSASILLWN